jgi:hypothetical protein
MYKAVSNENSPYDTAMLILIFELSKCVVCTNAITQAKLLYCFVLLSFQKFLYFRGKTLPNRASNLKTVGISPNSCLFEIA